MATTDMDYENANGDRFDDEAPRYDRNRSASPRRDDGLDDTLRRRSASPMKFDDSRSAAAREDVTSNKEDDGAINPGSNLFVTGIHPRLTEQEVGRLFEKYGEVEKCQIMRDPHTKDSRGFGFVKMVTPEQADAAKEGLQGEVVEGRTLSIEKARRSRPRTPTPGKYFGPPKRDPRPSRFSDRGYDDRRRAGYGGGHGGSYGRDDPYRYRGYRDDRGYDRGYRDDRGHDRSYRDDRNHDRRDRDDGYGRADRYAGRDDRDRYGSGRDDRRGGGHGYDRDRGHGGRGDRDDRAPRDVASYADAPRDSRDPYSGR